MDRHIIKTYFALQEVAPRVQGLWERVQRVDFYWQVIYRLPAIFGV